MNTTTARTESTRTAVRKLRRDPLTNPRVGLGRFYAPAEAVPADDVDLYDTDTRFVKLHGKSIDFAEFTPVRGRRSRGGYAASFFMREDEPTLHGYAAVTYVYLYLLPGRGKRADGMKYAVWTESYSDGYQFDDGQ